MDTMKKLTVGDMSGCNRSGKRCTVVRTGIGDIAVGEVVNAGSRASSTSRRGATTSSRKSTSATSLTSSAADTPARSRGLRSARNEP